MAGDIDAAARAATNMIAATDLLDIEKPFRIPFPKKKN
jgi:hypothetical protein